MLTADLIKPRLRKRGAALHIESLEVTRQTGRTASDLIALFGQHIGQPRRAWHEALERYEGVRTDYVVIRGMAKVLEDEATFTPLETPIPPEDLRSHLLARGPVYVRTDLFRPQTREDVVSALAAELEIAPEQIETTLYADRPAEYLLTDVGAIWTPESLIARYNLELARGALYWSDKLDIDIHDNYKHFWRYLKLFKLMFWATPHADGGYHVELDGPISPFVQATTRYGRQFAAFLPALLLCQKWQMTASVRMPQTNDHLLFHLNHTTSLRSHFHKSGAFDSRLEADFSTEFEAKFGGERGKWTLTREDEVLLLGDTVMIPDFSVTNRKDGRRALIEIVGFWHPDYLRRKVAKLREAKRRNMILLVYEGVNLSPNRLKDVPGEVLYFPNKPVLKDVMAAIERAAH
jgi:predicted nuclease of restriction endonuclease-like RecB superfamily